MSIRVSCCGGRIGWRRPFRPTMPELACCASGIGFYSASSLPQSYCGGAFVGGHPNGMAQDVATGFLNDKAKQEAGLSAWLSTNPARC